ncbi:MAG: radical SAM protein [Desulfobacteraceae bacterium]|nr:MAG: radical SAM protein [Desulfobacteraceae bacterium]
MKTKLKPGFNYIFGPVPSRRLGLSLGVDLMPHKTCSLNCVYCECGKTTHLTIKRKDYTPFDQIRKELDTVLSSRPRMDFLTFSGSGEPTLHSSIGEIIQYMKTDYPEYAVAVLTNGTMFHLPEVRKAVLQADVVIASFDAASDHVFQTINRPHPDLELHEMVKGLAALRKEFSNQLWMEIFIVPGHNDDQHEMEQIQRVMDIIKPYQIHINSLDRPGTEDWVKPVTPEVLKSIQACMHNVRTLNHSKHTVLPDVFSGDLMDLILSTVKRRPCTVEDILEITGADHNKINQHLDILLKNGEVVKKQMPRGTFFFRKQ